MKLLKIIKETLHIIMLTFVVLLSGYLAYYNEWEIISNYKDIVVLGFMLILIIEIVFNGGKK